MNAMILAAGRGTRLGNLGERVAKVLVAVGGEPLLSQHLTRLQRDGVEHVVVNAYHLVEQLESFAEAYEGPLELTLIREQRLLGTAGAVRNALRHLVPGPFLVLYGDVLVEESLLPLIAAHRRNAADATVAVHEALSGEGKGIVELDADGRVVGFVEKGLLREGRVLINSGIYVLEAEFVKSVPEDTELDFGHDVFPEAIDRGQRVFAHVLPAPVIDVGTPEGLALARARFSTAPTKAAL
jgi:NDP-sugar pyrophosphorylase family protein